MDLVLQEGQKRLEERRRALPRRTDPTLIGSVVPNLHPIEGEKISVFPFNPDLRQETVAALQASDEEARRARIKAAQIQRYLADSCLGERFKGQNFADYQPVNTEAAEVLRMCQQFAADFAARQGKSLIFVGSPGTGKNMLSAIIGQSIIRRGFSFLHTTAFKVVRRFKDSWKQDGVTEEAVLRYFVAPDLLVIDEVGVQFGTAAEQLYLTELINDRYEALKATILISNLKLVEIEGMLGERCMERFHENGSQVLLFRWPSYRRQQRGKS